MRILIISCLFLMSFGCSQTKVSNTQIIDQIEEKIEFDVVNVSESIKRATSFIRKVNREQPKARFEIVYKTAASEFVDKLNAKFSSEGILKNRYSIILAENEQVKSVTIRALYIQIESNNCGVLNFKNRDKYRFGCALEHNRNISLVNPVKSVK
ncbi:ATPase [Vibrio sp. TRT 21S02]|uniref:ATPase n=1 Tax=Vibrio sp. TRT 21S02 TaxID=3418507 RepID=UPI003CEB1A52